MTDWAPRIPKVTALITRPGCQGPEVIVFEHPSAGIQLPSGTVEDGESFTAGAAREAWEETGALGLELVGELAVLRRDFAGRAGAIAVDVSAAGNRYTRGYLVQLLRVDDDLADARFSDGTEIRIAAADVARGEERRIFHFRSAVEMPDEWQVVTPDGGGLLWTCFWVPIDDAHELLHEYQRDWLDAARPALDGSAVDDPRPRARPALPAEFGEGVFEQFVAPPMAGRRFALEMTDACDPEACSRAHGLCVTAAGEVVLIRENGFWDLPGGGKEAGESTAQNFAREVLEEVCARVVESRFLTALRIVELDQLGAPTGPVELQAQMWARVELDPWGPKFEVTERRALPPAAAADLSLHSAITRVLLERAAVFDPLLAWEPE